MGLFRQRRGDIAAAYEQYADLLYRVALSYLHSDSDAQDAVHDVFLKYAQRVYRFADSEHERAWFIRVTINRSLDLLKKRNIRSYVPLDELAEMLPASEAFSDQASDLMQALASIPETYRAAIVLHDLEGYSVEETAAILSLSVSAVKMRLSRGRNCLKTKLKEE